MSVKHKGFTLIELIIVIAVLAVLSVVVILVLDPAQMIKRARDAQRISDLQIIKKALSLYITDVFSPTIAKSGSTCYTSVTSTISATCGGRHNTVSQGTSTDANLIKVNGTGWVGSDGTAGGPDLTKISAGAPIGQWPDDPVNNTTYFYSYVASTTSNFFELNAKMESAKYQNGGPNDVESRDGGSSSTVYEVGTIPGLNL
jgi:prepilin-type N-terminal cleavage/methylation domain-containing protein